MLKGSCLCGGVTFEVNGELPSPNACHCSQCRKTSGHYWASADVPRPNLELRASEHLRWFRSSEKVRRGFCSRCGSSLFWDPIEHETIAVAMGSLDGTTEAKLRLHIHVADKGDYYEIGDGLPQNEH